MSQAHFPLRPTQTTDPFAAFQDRLAKAVAAPLPGRERQWAEAVKYALAGIERGLMRRVVLADTPDGWCPEIDCTRATLARQADEVRRHRFDLLAQTVALREDLEGAAQDLPAAAAPDFGAVRSGAAELLTELQRTDQAETDLVLESVNTDIGVGD